MRPTWYWIYFIAEGVYPTCHKLFFSFKAHNSPYTQLSRSDMSRSPAGVSHYWKIDRTVSILILIPHTHLCPYTSLPIHNSAHTQLCPYTTLPLLNSTHTHLCPYTTLPIHNSTHTQLSPYSTLFFISHIDFIISYCAFEMRPNKVSMFYVKLIVLFPTCSSLHANHPPKNKLRKPAERQSRFPYIISITR